MREVDVEQADRPHFLGFIPVSGASKSMPGNGIARFAGRPLLSWVLDAAVESRAIDQVVVATGDGEVARVARVHPSGAVRVVQPNSVAIVDDASGERAILEYAHEHDFEHVVLIHAAFPTLLARHLDEGMDRYLETQAESLLSVTRQTRHLWTAHPDRTVTRLDGETGHLSRGPHSDGHLVENGAFYITSRAGLLAHGTCLHGRIASYEMPAITCVDPQEPHDWLALEAVVRAGNEAGPPRDDLLASIRLVLTDVDGVLTDGGMFYSEDGNDLKKFHARDGMGFDILRELGVRTGIITGKDSKVVARRAETLAIDEVHQGIGDKLAVLHDICTRLDIRPHHVAYLGDDRNDIATMRAVGFAAAPADAHPDAKEVARYVCQKAGGDGCFREVADRIQRARRADSRSLDDVE